MHDILDQQRQWLRDNPSMFMEQSAMSICLTVIDRIQQAFEHVDEPNVDASDAEESSHKDSESEADDAGEEATSVNDCKLVETVLLQKAKEMFEQYFRDKPSKFIVEKEWYDALYAFHYSGIMPAEPFPRGRNRAECTGLMRNFTAVQLFAEKHIARSEGKSGKAKAVMTSDMLAVFLTKRHLAVGTCQQEN